MGVPIGFGIPDASRTPPGRSPDAPGSETNRFPDEKWWFWKDLRALARIRSPHAPRALPGGQDDGSVGRAGLLLLLLLLLLVLLKRVLLLLLLLVGGLGIRTV